ncbi:hypothetical protein [Rhizobacter sp. OV335]|uniref:hypothetical protein n=1 Tax=Rhizobacter sp. OV335 TaxID=1500264 RepID=UPI001160EE34|nr:hypothetical protein [Rhizobacter sp. OV335]
MAKPKPSSPHMTFAQSAVGSRDRVWFVAEEEDDSRVLQLKGGKWFVKTPEWPVASICGVDKGNGQFEVLALGLDGELLVGIPGGFSESHVDPQAKGPDRYGAMRDIRWVDSDVFAVGMSRQAYRRSGGAWQAISGAIHAQKGESTGFNSVHGLTPQAVYAVGFGGEIWLYDGSAWRQLDSPTSVALQRVLVTPSGHALMCGAAGVLLQAAGDRSTTVQNEVTRDNLHGLTLFKGKAFVASLTGLYLIGPKGLEAVDTGLPGPLTFGHLESDADVIWSVGARHLLSSEDGVTWTQVMCNV